MTKELDVIAFDVGGKHWEPGFSGLGEAQLQEKAQLIAQLWATTVVDQTITQRLYEKDETGVCVRLYRGQELVETYRDNQNLLTQILEYPDVAANSSAPPTPRNPTLTIPPSPTLLPQSVVASLSSPFQTPRASVLQPQPNTPRSTPKSSSETTSSSPVVASQLLTQLPSTPRASTPQPQPDCPPSTPQHNKETAAHVQQLAAARTENEELQTRIREAQEFSAKKYAEMELILQGANAKLGEEITSLRKQLVGMEKQAQRTESASPETLNLPQEGNNAVQKPDSALVSSLEQRLSNAETNLNDMTARLKEASRTIEAQRIENSELVSQNSRLLEEQRVFHQLQEAAQQTHASLRVKLESTISDQEANITLLKANAGLGSCRITQLQTENSRLRKEVDSARKASAKEVARQAEELEQEREKFTQLDGRHQALLKEKVDQAVLLKETEARAETLQYENAKGKHSRKKRSRQLEEALIKTQAELNDVHKELNVTQAALTSTTASATASAAAIIAPVQQLSPVKDPQVLQTISEVLRKQKIDQVMKTLAKDTAAEALPAAKAEATAFNDQQLDDAFKAAISSSTD